MQYEIEIQDGASLIRVAGDITAADRNEFDGVCAAALKNGVSRVTVDLGKLEFMDSAGLGFLLILLKRAEESGATVGLANPRGKIAELLELSRFHLLFDIEDKA